MVDVPIDSADLKAAVAVVYAAQLPIRVWWPAEERSAVSDEYAGEAARVLRSEFDGIVDRVTDWVARSQFIGEERSALIEAEQQVLLDEVGSSARNDLARRDRWQECSVVGLSRLLIAGLAGSGELSGRLSAEVDRVVVGSGLGPSNTSLSVARLAFTAVGCATFLVGGVVVAVSVEPCVPVLARSRWPL